MTRAFSLVELSIVLVILGLLTGGILAGQSLIRAAELRSVTTEYQKHIASVQTFRDKYLSLPGDMTNATRFWGDDNAACADAAIPNGTPGTCNGDGDGRVEYNGAGAGGSTQENVQFWKQLQLAGLVEGSYTGLAGPSTPQEAVLGTNTPTSKMSNTGWSVWYTAAPYVGSATVYAGTYLNILTFGTKLGTSTMQGVAIRPEEAWNIDTKVDDGRPAYGKLFAGVWDSCTDATSETDFASDYLLTSTATACSLFFREAF